MREVRNDARPLHARTAHLVRATVSLVQGVGQMKNTPALSTATGVFKEQPYDFIEGTASSVDPLLSRSTTTAAQLARILAALRRGPKSTDELRALGIYQVSARIFALRALGYAINTDLFTDYAADGYSHQRMARYTLDEPAQPWVRPVKGSE